MELTLKDSDLRAMGIRIDDITKLAKAVDDVRHETIVRDTVLLHLRVRTDGEPHLKSFRIVHLDQNPDMVTWRDVDEAWYDENADAFVCVIEGEECSIPHILDCLIIA